MISFKAGLDYWVIIITYSNLFIHHEKLNFVLLFIFQFSNSKINEFKIELIGMSEIKTNI